MIEICEEIWIEIDCFYLKMDAMLLLSCYVAIKPRIIKPNPKQFILFTDSEIEKDR